jgi:hypothetical protein
MRIIGWFKTGVSGLLFVPIFKVQSVQEGGGKRTAWLLKKESLGSSETSILNQPTIRNKPVDGRIQNKLEFNPFMRKWLIVFLATF